MKVSVVIPTYNRHEVLYRTLYSLFRQNDSNYEVIVCNDDDEDKYHLTEEVVNDFIAKGMPVKSYFTGKYKRGRGWSVETYPYNVGIRKATGDIIILNSGDVMSVTATIQQHRSIHTGKDNLAVFSTVHALTGAMQNNIDTYDWKNNPMSLLFPNSTYKMFTGEGISFTGIYRTEEAHTPYHFQMSILKKHLIEIHGFDEDYYGRMTCGDDDMADRLRRKGLVFQFVSSILAIHQYHGCPENISGTGGGSKHNPKVGSGFTLFHDIRSKQNIVRNANHEWGEFPRNMEKLPDMSGPV